MTTTPLDPMNNDSLNELVRPYLPSHQAQGRPMTKARTTITSIDKPKIDPLKDLNAQIDAFFAKGGKVTQVPIGASAESQIKLGIAPRHSKKAHIQIKLQGAKKRFEQTGED